MDETAPEPESDVPATSQLARLRAKAEKSRRHHFVDVHLEPIDVMIRYSAIGLERIDQIIRRNQAPGQVATASLVEACQAIFVVEDGRAVSLDPDGDAHLDDQGQLVGQPVTFASPRLAQILEREDAKGPDLVHALYGLAGRTAQIPRDSDDIIYLSRGETDRMTRPPGVSGAA